MWAGLFHEVSFCEAHACRVRRATFGAKILALPCSNEEQNIVTASRDMRSYLRDIIPGYFKEK